MFEWVLALGGRLLVSRGVLRSSLLCRSLVITSNQLWRFEWVFGVRWVTAGVQGCPQVSLCWLERTVVVYSMHAVAVRVNSYTWRRNVTNPAVALSDPHPDSDAFPLPFIIWHYPYPEIPKVTGELVLHLRKVC
ncbi:unnamed protein product, partial [Pylaiella littoralis]